MSGGAGRELYEMNESILRYLLIGAVIVALIGVIAALVTSGRSKGGGEGQPRRTRSFPPIEPAYKTAGRAGEKAAAFSISRVLRDEDRLFSNVEFEYDGRPCEIDQVIVNRNGVFIIEVKNYEGVLRGGEDDFEWQKTKMTGDGENHVKIVKNPIKQVKRQAYLLAQHLRYYGFDVWVEGYVWLIRGNSPVDGPFVLNSEKDVDREIHARSKRPMSPEKIKQIAKLIGNIS